MVHGPGRHGDAADAVVAYLKFLEGRGQAPPGAVVKAATDLMGVMERSKAEVETSSAG